MQKDKILTSLLTLLAAVFVCVAFVIDVSAQQNGKNGKQITIPVTVHADSDRMRAIADKLQLEDFIVRENKQKQQIISVKRPSETPIILSILIQDDLVSHVGNEIKGIKEFIQNLPNGSQVMVGYITAGSLRVTQEFTDDLARATESLRIPISSTTASPYSPYVELLDAVRLFDGRPVGKRMILIISDGLDLSQGFRGGSPMFSTHLERAIRAAQQRGIAVYSFYAPSTGLTSRSRLASTYGQGSLNRLSDETGGEAFFSGRDFVTFDPYFKELNELISNQWLITYRSTNTGKSFRRVEVKTDFDLHLHYPTGYYPK
ncbi:MAG: VWA domain-containing protein [Acidobacteriota bacterium]